MKSARLLCLFVLVLVPGLLRAALPPVPVVEITKVNLPKVEIRITNPSQTESCIIWRPGMSWEEQNKWFSLRKAAGGKVWELHPEPRAYTVNYPAPQEIPPGKSVECTYNFADNSWQLPEGFTGGSWKFEVQAHLEISRDTDAHRMGVFIGHVTSAWHNRAGREVEKAGAPQPDAKHAAMETLKDFPLKRLLARLEEWKTGTLPGKQSAGDFFGADFPWENLEGVSEWGRHLTVLLPDQRLLKLTFYDDLPGGTETMIIDGKKREVCTSTWLGAKEWLAKVPARRLRSIVVTGGKERALAFRRAFDEEGRIDPKETESLWH